MFKDVSFQGRCRMMHSRNDRGGRETGVPPSINIILMDPNVCWIFLKHEILRNEDSQGACWEWFVHSIKYSMIVLKRFSSNLKMLKWSIAALYWSTLNSINW